MWLLQNLQMHSWVIAYFCWISKKPRCGRCAPTHCSTLGTVPTVIRRISRTHQPSLCSRTMCEASAGVCKLLSVGSVNHHCLHGVAVGRGFSLTCSSPCWKPSRCARLPPSGFSPWLHDWHLILPLPQPGRATPVNSVLLGCFLCLSLCSLEHAWPAFLGAESNGGTEAPAFFNFKSW